MIGGQSLGGVTGHTKANYTTSVPTSKERLYWILVQLTCLVYAGERVASSPCRPSLWEGNDLVHIRCVNAPEWDTITIIFYSTLFRSVVLWRWFLVCTGMSIYTRFKHRFPPLLSPIDCTRRYTFFPVQRESGKFTVLPLTDTRNIIILSNVRPL